MSLFKKIGKAIGKGAKAVGKVAGKAAPALLGVAAGIALPVVGGAVGKGITALVSKTGSRIKGGKMVSAVDKVLDAVDPKTQNERKGLFGHGGFLGTGIGNGVKKAKKAIEAGQTYDEYERQAAARGIDPATGEPVKQSGFSPVLLGLLGIGGFMLFNKK